LLIAGMNCSCIVLSGLRIASASRDQCFAISTSEVRQVRRKSAMGKPQQNVRIGSLLIWQHQDAARALVQIARGKR
jgi:hypothetical protein